MNINYEYYKIFYYCAKYKSFTKAANILFSNQPNISRIIAKLEKELNCTLFVRTRNGLLLTNEGKTLYEHIKIAQKYIMDGEEELSKQHHLESGTISIGVTETALNVFLLDKLEIFKKKYPNIHLKMTNNSTPVAIQALDNGNVDIAIVVSPTQIQPYMEQIELMDFKDVLTVGKEYYHLSNTMNSIQDINIPLIMLEKNTTTYSFFYQFYKKNQLDLNPEIEVATTDQVLPLVKHNLGMGFLPFPFVKQEIEKKEIFEVPIKEKLDNRHIVLIMNTKYPSNTAVKEFIETIKEPL